MAQEIQARYFFAFTARPDIILLTRICEVMEDHLDTDTVHVPHVANMGKYWIAEVSVDWHAPQSFDEVEMLSDVQSLDKDMVAAIGIDVSSNRGSFSFERSNQTNEYWTRVILASFVKEMVSNTMGSFDTVVPSDMLPQVTI